MLTRLYETGDLDYSSVLLGMLVMQDVQLSLFIAVMPTLIQAQSGDLGGSVLLFGLLIFTTCKHILHLGFLLFCFVHCSLLFGSLRILHLLAQVLLCLAAVLLLCLLLKSFLIGPYYKKLHVESKDNKEILVLGMSAFVFFMLTVQTHFKSFDFVRFVTTSARSCVAFSLSGDRVFGCFHGAGLFPGRSFAVHAGSHGHNRHHGMRGANQRFPRHHLLCLYWSDTHNLWLISALMMLFDF